MERKYIKKFLIAGLIFLLFFNYIPISSADTYTFSDGIVIIFGRCNIAPLSLDIALGRG